ncbi:putative Cell volume regulation protein A, CvrA [Magnetospirillum sp. LM-5]|uniref:potassium/proton antiporter n=1 Tax=Magnetospirillum sp. LM-5 TaxID=2681466 RepID=UPI0013810725|nr:potassium/proton antiporter [Magnetospirillum sp. LM-5]CAA7624802.1 putative Cell volume regulation protein A, CvrA [Magnetospirillum sp. LM-5]
MIESLNITLLVLSGLVTLSIFSSLLSFRVGAPLLLVFLAVGLLAGEDGLGGIRFDDVGTAYAIGTVALAIVLFDAGFHTPLKSVRQAALPSLSLASVGVVLTAAIVAVPGHYLLGLDWPQGLLLGAIVASTDAAAVFFLLRVGGIHVRDRVRSILEVESGSNDPMAIFLTIVMIRVLTGGGGDDLVAFILGHLAMEVGIGLIAGLGGGYLIIAAVNRLGIERGLLPVAALSMALMLMAATALIGGSGFLAVYVAGLLAGNARLSAPDTMRRFQDAASWLAQIAMFLALGLLATPSQFLPLILPSLGVAFVLMFVARPVAVWVGLLPFRMNRNETAFVAWIGLRGAVSILLSILPMVAGMENGRLFFNVTFMVVLVSLALQGWTIAPVARWLGQVVPRRIGPVERVELEIPGTRHELVSYRIVPDSLVARGHKLPSWARPSLVVRDGHSFLGASMHALKPGDLVWLFARPERLSQLDRLFASHADAAEADRQFFGDFPIDPHARMSDLGLLYGLAMPPDSQDVTVAQWMRETLGSYPGIGDRVGLGEVELIVRALGPHDSITEIGLATEPTEIDKPKLPLFPSGREVRARIRRWLRR